MIKKFVFTILVGLLTFNCVAVSYAEDISFQASVDRNTIELGSFLQLTLVLKGTQVAPTFNLPDLPDFQSRYLGPATRLNIVNGQVTKSISFVYNLYPTKTGKFQIPSVEVAIDGRQYSTEPVNIEVISENTTQPQAVGNDEATKTLSEKVFITMGTSKQEYYINERVPLTIKLFIEGIKVRNVQYPEFDHLGFTVDNYGEPQQNIENLNGLSYRTIAFKTFIYPQREGDLLVGPAKLSAEILFEKKRSNSFGNFGSFFDDSFFDSFFGALESRPVTLESQSLGIRILALPEEGKPKQFSGAVGNYDFKVSVSPKKLRVGDPITVRMKVGGNGNLNLIQLPAFEESGFYKVYEPQIKVEDNEKILEQVVIPKTSELKKLPERVFYFFNPELRKYQSIRQGPFDIAVEALGSQEKMRVFGEGIGKDNLQSENQEELGQDIVFIKELPGRWMTRNYRLYRSTFFIVFLVLYSAFWLAFCMYYQMSHRLKTDEAFAKRMRAPRQARNGLKRAQNYLLKAEFNEFYDTLYKTLQRYFSNKVRIATGAVNIDSIKKALKGKILADDFWVDLNFVFEQCEMARYAKIEKTQDQMNTALALAWAIIDRIERLK